MKEYTLFVKQNGDAQLYGGGQFMLGAAKLGTARNIATIWNALDSFGERVVELRETGIDNRSGELVFVLKTVPKSQPPRRY
jgi:hypothetical protein